MTKCLTTFKTEYIFKQGTGAISLLHLRTTSNHLVCTFTSTDLVADALKVGNIVTGDTSGEHASSALKVMASLGLKSRRLRF